MTELLGTRLNRYEIRERIGKGGMASVYKAWDTNLERWVAVKVLHAHLADDADFKTRFEREAKLIAKLNHPNIVQVYDFDAVERDGELIYYMVMPYIEGETLRQRMEARRANGETFSLAEVAAIMRGVCAALSYAHKQGMVHRDVTPGNILFGSEGQPVLADFGIARMVEGARITRSGTTSGTPLYMSPEQSTGAESDSRADIYSLGVILFELLSSKAPFEGDSAVAILMQHVNAPIPRLTDHVPTLPPDVDAIIARALAKAPDERYPSVEAFLNDLELKLFNDSTLRLDRVAALSKAAEPPSSRSTRMPLQTELLPRTLARTRSAFPLNILILLAIVALTGLSFIFFNLPAAPLAEEPSDPTLQLRPIRTRNYAGSMASGGPLEFVDTFSGERLYRWEITTNDPDIYRNVEQHVESVLDEQSSRIRRSFYRIRSTALATAFTSLFAPGVHSYATKHVYEADVILSPQSQLETATGIVFRYRSEDQYYVFAINGLGQVSLWARANGEWQELRGLDQAWTLHEAVKPIGELNRLRLVDNEVILQAYVNDVLVIEVRETPQWYSGSIGIYLATTQSPFVDPFAEVRVTRFSAQALRSPRPTEMPTLAAFKS